MRNIAICDDEPLYRERLAQSVRAHGNGQAAQLQLFDSPAALLQAVHMHGYAPDIAVLDIQMDEMTGIELAKQLNAALPQCAIIFVSSFLGFATDVYEAEHTYFILKSELEQRIGTALQRALNRNVPPVLHYPVTQGYRSVSCAQVLCLERILRRTKLTLLGGITEGQRCRLRSCWMRRPRSSSSAATRATGSTSGRSRRWKMIASCCRAACAFPSAAPTAALRASSSSPACRYKPAPP